MSFGYRLIKSCLEVGLNYDELGMEKKYSQMKFLDLIKLEEANQITTFDTSSVILHKNIIQKKGFLKKLYYDFYNELKKALKDVPKGKIVEIGTGAGFIKELIPEAITSDMFSAPGIDIVLPASKLPFDNNTISAIVMFDVLHHIENPSSFFKEALRCLIHGGKIVMIEPNSSIWGDFIYKNFHHEPFDKNATWQSGVNGALPWIIFFRDKERFEKDFPDLKIVKLKPHTPLRYLISGGLSFKQFLPSFTYDFIKLIEAFLAPLNKFIGMFLTIELKKIS